MTTSIALPCANGPDLAWPALLSKARDTVVIFTSVQCPYALEYYSVLAELAGRFAGPHYQFLMVNPNVSTEDGPEDLEEMRSQYGFHPIPFVRDENSSLAKLLGATHTPQAFVVSADGRVRWSGPIDSRFKPPEEWHEGISGHWPWDDAPPPAPKVTRLEEILDRLRAGDDQLRAEAGIGCTIKTATEEEQ